MNVMERAVTENFARDTASGTGTLGLLAVMFAGASAPSFGYDVAALEPKTMFRDAHYQAVTYARIGNVYPASATVYTGDLITANSLVQVYGGSFASHTTIVSIYSDSVENDLARQLVRVATDLAGRQTELDPGAKRVLYGRMRELIRR